MDRQTRVRVLLTSDKIVLRKFYWFEMKGDDFYWGSAYESRKLTDGMPRFSGIEATINIPDNFDELPKTHGKFSYHESGVVHYKMQSKNEGHTHNVFSKWKLKNEITKPVRFYTLFSRTLEHYNKLINNPTKDNTSAIILAFNPDDVNRRIYFEFFLSPEETFVFPETMIKSSSQLTNTVTHSLSKDLILVIRFGVMSSMGEWHPDKEIGFITDDLE